MRLVNLTVNGSGTRTIVNLDQVTDMLPLISNPEHSVINFAVWDPASQEPYSTIVDESLAEIWTMARDAMP